MKYSLRCYVDSLFENAPRNDAAAELHDEILADLEARYDDCINSGMSPKRAYAASVGSVGNVETLIAQLSGKAAAEGDGIFRQSVHTGRIFEKLEQLLDDKNFGLISSAAIAIMWLLITAFYIITSSLYFMWDFCWLIFLVGAILNVIISTLISIAKIRKKDDTRKSRIKILSRAEGCASAVMWLVTVIVFFVINRLFRMWNISWVIFIFASIFQIILSTFFKIQKRKL